MSTSQVVAAVVAATSLVVASCASDPTADEEGDETAAAAEVTDDVEPGADPAGSSAGVVDGLILYQAVFDGEVDLGLVRADGSEARRLPGGPGNRWHPDWSPDGTEIAYDHDAADGPAGISVVTVDGGDDRIVAPCDGPCLGRQDPAWSPDGRSIAFVAGEGPTDEHPDGVGYLALYDVASGEERRILDSSGLDEDIVEARTPRFGPDGEQLVMGAMRADGAWALVTLTVEGENLTPITDWGHGARPDWSPDGEWIVHQGTENEPPDLRPGVAIHRVRPDGSDLEQLTTPEGNARDTYPRWLPDGSAIIFSRCSGLWTCETRLVDPDGTNDRLLFDELGTQTVHVMWQPTHGG